MNRRGNFIRDGKFVKNSFFELYINVRLHQMNETWTNIFSFFPHHSLDRYLQVFTLSEHSPVCRFPCSEKIKIVPFPLHRLKGCLLFSIPQRTEGVLLNYLGTEAYKSSVCNFRKWINEKKSRKRRRMWESLWKVEDDMEGTICFQI